MTVPCACLSCIAVKSAPQTHHGPVLAERPTDRMAITIHGSKAATPAFSGQLRLEAEPPPDVRLQPARRMTPIRCATAQGEEDLGGSSDSDGTPSRRLRGCASRSTRCQAMETRMERRPKAFVAEGAMDEQLPRVTRDLPGRGTMQSVSAHFNPSEEGSDRAGRSKHKTRTKLAPLGRIPAGSRSEDVDGRLHRILPRGVPDGCEEQADRHG
jgi:hypothetical protein